MSPPDDATAYPSRGRAYWSVSVFCLAAVISYTDRLILSALVDPIKTSFDLGDSTVSLLQGAAFAVVYVVAGLPLGILADRNRRLTLLILGSSVWCAGTILCGIASSFWMLFAARVVVGIGEASLAPAAISMIADSFPPVKRGTATGIFLLGFSIGGPASITIGSFLMSLANSGMFARIPFIGALEPWRGTLVLAGMGGLAIPALLLTLREPARRDSYGRRPLGEMLRNLSIHRRSLGPIYAAMALLAIGDYGTQTWMPSVLSRRFAMPPMELGSVFGAITIIAGMLGCVIGGVGSDLAARHSGTRGRILFSLCAAAIASVGSVLISGSHVSFVLTGLGVWSLFSSMSFLSGMATVQNIVPNEYRGFGISIAAFCNTLFGLGIGPTVVALITDVWYRNPALVGFSITTVALPAGIVATLAFLYGSRGVFVRENAVPRPV